jgi:hypothetical protein
MSKQRPRHNDFETALISNRNWSRKNEAPTHHDFRWVVFLSSSAINNFHEASITSGLSQSLADNFNDLASCTGYALSTDRKSALPFLHDGISGVGNDSGFHDRLNGRWRSSSRRRSCVQRRARWVQRQINHFHQSSTACRKLQRLAENFNELRDASSPGVCHP